MNKTIFPVLLLILLSMVAQGQTDSTTLTKVGDQAPVFQCKTIDGKAIDVSKLKGKIIMINFFATWCPPCNLELPVLQKNIWEKYKNNPNFVLVILGREHNEKEVKDFVSKKNFKMPFAPDTDRAIFKLYATQNIPRNIIIGKDGKILFQNSGYTPEEFKEIENLLKENID
jgi:peroxiredoxin